MTVPLSPEASTLMPGHDAMLRVAVLEDDEGLREHLLLPELREHGFSPIGAGTAAELYRKLLQQRFDLALLDIGLPDEDGVSVAGHLRQLFPRIGIVMLTGHRDRDSHLQSLLKGADAYLPKPVDVDILMATLHRLARRVAAPPPVDAPAAPATPGAPAGVPGPWQVDADGWCLVAPGGAVLALTVSERELMRGLMRHRGEPVRREELIRRLVRDGDIHDFDPRRLDMLVHRLRRKVEVAVGPDQAFPLLAARGVGYVFAG